MDTLYGPISIREAEPHEVADLLEKSTHLLAGLYPSEANHLVSAEELSAPGSQLLGAFLGEMAVGMVGLRTLPDEGYAEIKRLFVSEIHRGAGIATALMAELEAIAVDMGVGMMRLETGVNQPESLSLYSRLGYTRCDAFGSYRADDYSVFMEKSLP